MEYTVHAPEPLIWMVPSDLRPKRLVLAKSPALLLPLRLPSFPLQPGRAQNRFVSRLLTIKTQKPPNGVLFLQILPLIGPACRNAASGTNRPLSSRNARVHREARSRLCVTRIEVNP